MFYLSDKVAEMTWSFENYGVNYIAVFYVGPKVASKYSFPYFLKFFH